MIFCKGQSTRKVNKQLVLGDGRLEKIAQSWTNHGYQQNISHVQIYHAINKDHTLSKIARYIRLKVYNSTNGVSEHFLPDMCNIRFRLLVYICVASSGSLLFTTNPWNGVAKVGKRFQSIPSSINRVHKGIKNEK